MAVASTSMIPSSEEDLVLAERLETPYGSIGLLTLNRGAERNPINAATLAALEVELLAMSEGDAPVRAVIITGSGPAFSSGGDLKKYQDLFGNPDAFLAFLQHFRRVCELLERMRPVTVAMVNGACVAGGLELALACDLIVVAESARMGDGHLRFAQLPGAGSSQRLLSATGSQRGKFWLLSGRLFSAAEAVAAGVALEAVPDEELLGRTLEILADITVHSPLAVEQMKLLIRAASTETLDDGLDVEIEAAVRYATQSRDAMEGLMAFAERRTPRYEGR
jgi:enoyl-CoA hydratase/carnithine racemase